MTQIRTEEKMFPLVVEWLASGISQKEFGQRHELTLYLIPIGEADTAKRILQQHPPWLPPADLFHYLLINQLKELLPPYWKIPMHHLYRKYNLILYRMDTIIDSDASQLNDLSAIGNEMSFELVFPFEIKNHDGSPYLKPFVETDVHLRP